MITLRLATLCDAASVREGLLNVLGAGITLLQRQSFPAPLTLSLALLFELEADLPDKGYRVDIELRDSKGEVGVRMGGAINTANAERPFDPSIPSSVPFIASLDGVGIPRADSYEFVISLEGQVVSTLKFAAVLVETLETTEIPIVGRNDIPA